jgi:hypothetical protein
MAAISTLQDGFPGSSLSGLWATFGTGGTNTVTVGSGYVEFNIDGSVAAPNEVGIRSVDNYSLIGSSVYARLVQPTASDGNLWNLGEDWMMLRNEAGDEGLGWLITYGNTRQIRAVAINDLSDWWSASEMTAINYSATDHAWLRIREDSGTIYWDTAPDSGGSPGTWTNRHSVAVASLTNFDNSPGASVKLEMRTGYWSTPGADSWFAGNPRWDGVNTSTSSAVTHATSGALAGSGAALAGTAARSTTASEHATSGALVGPGSALAGTAARSRTHTSSGALTGPGAALAGTAARSAATGALASIQDAFDAASINTAKWDTFILGAAVGTISQVGGKLRLDLTSGVTGNQLLVQSDDIKSLVGSEVYTKLSRALVVTNNTGGAEARLSLVSTTADDALGWHQQADGTIEPQWRIAGLSVSGGAVSYTPATHAWLRIRESGGTVYWDTAPSSASDPPLPGDWVNRFSKPLSELFSVTSMKIVHAVTYWGGTPGAPTGPVEFDCVNTQTRAGVEHTTSGALAGPGASLVGAAARKIIHATSGALLAQAGSLAGQGRREKAHHCTGALVGDSAIITGISSTSDATRHLWVAAQDTGGAWADQSSQDSDPWTPVEDTGGAWGS